MNKFSKLLKIITAVLTGCVLVCLTSCWKSWTVEVTNGHSAVVHVSVNHENGIWETKALEANEKAVWKFEEAGQVGVGASFDDYTAMIPQVLTLEKYKTVKITVTPSSFSDDSNILEN